MGKKRNNLTLGSTAEDLFLELFSEVFGIEKTHYLFIQYPFADIYGNNRFIDFALEMDHSKVAIEIDGETFHNPYRVSDNKYYDDLLKQNSMVYNNWKVYRWVYNQIKNQPEMVKDQLKQFLSEYPLFKDFDDYLPTQRGKAMVLKDHQVEALESLSRMRGDNESIALLYHATGTGKTVTAVSDAKIVAKPTLFLAHTKELVYQARDTFRSLWSEVSTGIFMGEQRDKNAFVLCASVQSIVQNLGEFHPNQFGYIIIDEAHHSTAPMYQRILNYFRPSFTLGLTATPERMDGENLLQIFQNIAHRLDLKTAIDMDELVPIRCIRVKTNVDLSEVRIHGVKYNSQDLESKLFLPERNSLIVDTYIEYVRDKKTVVFCASVKHAEEIAALFRDRGLRAEGVSGSMHAKRRSRILKSYEDGDIDILCACDLLNEGWDSPRTEVLFMARPTMSKTIYMQQLGRGTRKYPGKDHLMIFDFIDNANLFNLPLSAHRVFNVAEYHPGGYVVVSDKARRLDEDMLRRGEKPLVYLDFPVDIADFEHIDLFNWQEKVKEMISQLEFVRMVDVQEETVNRYIIEGRIIPDFEVPMGSRTFKFFNKETVDKYAREFNWDIITSSNIKDKFIDFVGRMDMAYSYKPVLLLAMLEHCDENGRVRLEDVVDFFIDYYSERKHNGLTIEKANSIFCKEGFTKAEVKRNILSNPFKRFEDMRFMRKSKDLDYIELNSVIWKKLMKEEKAWIITQSKDKLEEYYRRF